MQTENVTISAAMVHDALERAGGDRKIAAELLGWSAVQVKEKIWNNAILKARWASEVVEPPNEASVLSREAFEPKTITLPGSDIDPNLFTDEQVAQCLHREDRKLKQGLSRLNLNGKELEIALALQNFHAQHFRSSIEIVGAGMTVTSLKLQTQLAEIGDRLTFVRKQIETLGELANEAREGWVREEKSLMDSYVLVADQLRKCNEVSIKGAATMALIKIQANKKQEKRAKPGFTSEAPIETT